MAKSRRACIFCKRKPVSQEHLLAAWMADCFPNHRRRAAHFHARQDLDGQTSKLYKLRPFTATVGCVCRPCNNQWMNRLEGRVRPILRPMMTSGLAMALAPTDQLALAAWATKTAIVMVRGRASQADAISDVQCAYLRREGRPPPEFQVWLGRRDREPVWPYRCLAITGEAEVDGEYVDAVGEQNVFRAAIAIGHVVVQVAGHRLAGRADIFKQADGFIEIWPTMPRVAWPIEPTVSLKRVERDFASRELRVAWNATDERAVVASPG